MNEYERMSFIIRLSLIPNIIEYMNLKTLEFDKQRLIDTCYSKNIDIFGAISSYMCYISKAVRGSLSSNLLNLPQIHNFEFLQLEIFNIIMKYMYNPNVGLKPYNIDEVTTDLKNLNKIFRK